MLVERLRQLGHGRLALRNRLDLLCRLLLEHIHSSSQIAHSLGEFDTARLEELLSLLRRLKRLLRRRAPLARSLKFLFVTIQLCLEQATLLVELVTLGSERLKLAELLTQALGVSVGVGEFAAQGAALLVERFLRMDRLGELPLDVSEQGGVVTLVLLA